MLSATKKAKWGEVIGNESMLLGRSNKGLFKEVTLELGPGV